ncbi:TIGR01777 family oxidoreductase [Marinilabiliaceae bacterium ANBcel2]|nr:TIGR01777 family oxidoreductase [Marinilabiliaceae bacterium ANBcel2]
MKISICGINGLIGDKLAKSFYDRGYEVIPVLRGDLSKGSSHIASLIDGSIAVINIAGAPVFKRWSQKWKSEIYNSRILTTKVLVDAVNSLSSPPKKFISVSATGIYDHINVHDEFSTFFDSGFLAYVCRDWESAALEIDSSKAELTIFRLGVVLSNRGGAFKKLLPVFKYGVGGPVGSGKQYFPWIHIDDVVNAFIGAVELNRPTGVYNLVAPEIVTNGQFSRVLGRVLSRPAILPLPAFLLKTIYGEAASMLLLGQQVIPQRLLADGFDFKYPRLEEGLKSLI